MKFLLNIFNCQANISQSYIEICIISPQLECLNIKTMIRLGEY